jgi:hypothetical protein
MAERLIVPYMTFMSKTAINFAYICTIQASFTDKSMFPMKVRATAIGTSQIFARTLTVLAPQVTELKSPRPILCFIAVSGVALVTSMTFKKSQKMEVPKEIKDV